VTKVGKRRPAQGERFKEKMMKKRFNLLIRLLKLGSIEAGLPDDRLQRSDANFSVIGNRNGDGTPRKSFLHDNVTSAPTHFLETMPCQN